MAEKVREATATMSPFTHYEDGTAAIDWLCQAFGFERREVHEGEDGTIVHAELAYGASVLMLDSKRDTGFGLESARKLGAVSGGVYVYVEDVDAHYERAKAAGAEVLRELADTGYGSREYVARDLESTSGASERTGQRCEIRPQASVVRPSSCTVQLGLCATSQAWPSGSMKTPE